MTMHSTRPSDVALLQQLLDRAMRPGDPVTLDAWTCAAESVFKSKPPAEAPSPPERSHQN